MSGAEERLRGENEMVGYVLPLVGEDRMENTGKYLSHGRKGKETKFKNQCVVYLACTCVFSLNFHSDPQEGNIISVSQVRKLSLGQ